MSEYLFFYLIFFKYFELNLVQDPHNMQTSLTSLHSSTKFFFFTRCIGNMLNYISPDLISDTEYQVGGAYPPTVLFFTFISL